MNIYYVGYTVYCARVFSEGFGMMVTHVKKLKAADKYSTFICNLIKNFM
jgi:hypothetical protein